MAVDTRDKRFSMMGFGAPARLVMPNPDGGFAIQGDRQQLVYLYRGILAAASSAATLVGQWANVIQCMSTNQRIEAKSANKRIDCYAANERLET